MHPISACGQGALALFASAALSACQTPRFDPVNQRPAYLGAVHSVDYDGIHDDLLTAGLGLAGLLAPAPPAYLDPLHPTAAELRRNAIHFNYRAVLDPNPLSGFGSLYGPSGLIAGTEYLAFSDDGSGNRNVSLMVQVPANFDVDHPCIVTGTSSGSLGIYGAIGSSGEWGLKHRCAVAYTDKGTGTGLYLFDDDSVNLITGERVPRSQAGKGAIFAPEPGPAMPGTRLAFKHAHSRQNSERDWGLYTLQSIEFAFYLLNERYGEAVPGGHRQRFNPRNTIVIASSSSNGGGAALRALEQDEQGLISGLAVSEPQVQVPAGRTLFDITSYAALYQPCLAGVLTRCSALTAKGLLSGFNAATQQLDALRRLHDYGWLPDSDVLQAGHALTSAFVDVAYADAYSRASVRDKLCGFSFAATDMLGNPIPFNPLRRAASFAGESGIIGSIVYENSVGGPRNYLFASSPSSLLPDQALDGFLCLRDLNNAPALKLGESEVRSTGNLRGRPALIVQGRRDTVLPVTVVGRAYLAQNASVEGKKSQLSYIEVTNANHFDLFTSVFPAQVVPLHVYLLGALDAMYAHLRNGTPLPPSQVVRTVTRPNALVPITSANLPPISLHPRAEDAVTLRGARVVVPE